MRRQKLHFDNLDEVLKSSKSARSKGTQQFETPKEQAEALCLPLNPIRPTIYDPQCGHGALLNAAAVTAEDVHSLLGTDIDPTAAVPSGQIQSSVVHGDFLRILPLMRQAGLRFDMIVANPPFSLRWKMQRFIWQTVGNRLEASPSSSEAAPVTMNSTQATFEAIHAMLSKRGEGMMLCNAATCSRLLEGRPLWSKTWLRLTLPNFFPDTAQKMEMAAIYFASSHKGRAPMELTAADAMPATIRRTLEFAAQKRDKLIKGDTVRRPYQCLPNTATTFDAVKGEWKRITEAQYANLNGYNIRLTADGKLNCYLTPFQKLTGDVPGALVDAIAKIHGQHPAALVVQRISRKALLLAAKGAIWRVHPDVVEAVADAIRSYNAVRAPLRPLNTVQRLGHLDEEDEIRCERPLGIGFSAGRTYPLESETLHGRKIERRPHHRFAGKGKTEQVLVSGQELLLRIKDDAGKWHAFTQYNLGKAQQMERPEEHFHLLAELVECFHIPEVPDVAQVHPEKFATYQARLRALEWDNTDSSQFFCRSPYAEIP